MEIQGRTTERTNQGTRTFITELLRQLLILAIILVGIVASSLPAALLYQSADAPATNSTKISDASDANVRSVTPVAQHNGRLSFANDTDKREHSRRKIAN